MGSTAPLVVGNGHQIWPLKVEEHKRKKYGPRGGKKSVADQKISSHKGIDTRTMDESIDVWCCKVRGGGDLTEHLYSFIVVVR